tara:strand:+ start:617 stop:1336 length:720 start_codon:yes stop_codon:yes gene_type:complete
MRNIFSYLLATTLCFLGCSATKVVAPQPQPQEIKKEKRTSHTYVDDCFFDLYPFVGSVRNLENDLIGSGVLIASNMVLTAAHVSEGRDHDELVFVEYDGDSHCVSEVIYHEGYNPNELNHDISILVLESLSDEQPVALEDKPSKHMDLVAIGYGTGKKRFSNYGTFWYYGRLVDKPQFMIMLPLKGTIWFGDSGGGVFTYDNRLVGIISYLQTKNGIIYENGCASILYYKEWIEENING